MRKTRFVLTGLVLFMLIAAACGPKTTPHPPTVEVPTLPATQPAGEQGSEATAEDSTSEQPTAALEGPAPDIPIMEGAYKLQAARGGVSVVYQVDGEIAEVVEFYQDVLPGYGWELTGPPDSAVGAIASMMRENEKKDRLTINMQANTVGGFVVVNIMIVRGQ